MLQRFGSMWRMRRVLGVLILPLLLGLLRVASAQDSALTVGSGAEGVTHDILHMRGGRSLAVDLIRMEGDSIYYTLPGDQAQYRMTRNRVLSITHRDGREEELQVGGASQVKPIEWHEVQVTRNREDVRGMRLVARYDEKLTSSGHRRVRGEELEKGAIQQLQKRTAMKNGTHLYVKEVKFHTAYGEAPSIHIVAEGYRKLQLPASYQQPSE